MSWDRERFESLYAEGDPWGFFESQYEHQKYARTIGALADRRPPASIDSVLDLGCGNGAATKRIAEQYPDADVLGVDIAATAIDTARERAGEANYERADVVEFVRETERTFDAITELECLCYPASERSVTDMLAFARALRDAVDDDGLLVSTHVHMPYDVGPIIGQARTARTVRSILETVFELVGRQRYVEDKVVALDAEEPETQPYEVWTFRPE